jgi:hypothetical protein
VRRAVFAFAATVAAAGLGASLGGFGQLLNGAPRPVMLGWLLIGLLLVYGIADLRGHRLWVPSSTWRVPQTWSRCGELPFAGLFGAVLGLGFITEVNYVGYYVLLAICFASGSLSAGALLLGVFGFTRGVPLLLIAARAKGQGCVCGPDAVAQFNRAVYFKSGLIAQARGAALLCQAAVLIAGTLSR